MRRSVSVECQSAPASRGLVAGIELTLVPSLLALAASVVACSPSSADHGAAPMLAWIEGARDEARSGDAAGALDDKALDDDADDESVNEFDFVSSGTRKSIAIGNMDELECFKELKKLKIPHVRAPGAPKIEMPIILSGPILGVHFDTGRPYKERTIATGDAIDCRLGVSLHDLAKVAKKHGISKIIVKSFHRPNQPILDPNAPLRHRIGFAVDIAGFKTKKGATWIVKDDFNGKIGQQTCGASAAKPNPDTKQARELWTMFCEIAATGAFDSGISPNYNASHFDHVHFDLTADHPIVFFP